MYYIEMQTSSRNIGRQIGGPHWDRGNWERVDHGYPTQVAAKSDVITLKAGYQDESFIKFDYRVVFASDNKAPACWAANA